jgi:hypothetical protein
VSVVPAAVIIRCRSRVCQDVLPIRAGCLRVTAPTLRAIFDRRMNPTTDAPPPARRRRRWIILGVVLGLMLVLGVAGVATIRYAMGAFQDMARAPWAILGQVQFATRSDAQAAVFYEANPGLKKRYPTAEAYVEASRRWRPKLANLDPQPPDMWTLLKSGGGKMNISKTNDRSEFVIAGYRGLTARLVTDENDFIVDLEIE